MDLKAVIGGGLLIAGTSIGGAMLALPILTSVAGFFPTLVVYIVSALVMGATALLMSEVYLSIEGDSNLITMAEKTLGKGWKYVVWALYLYLFYCLMVAYLSGLGGLIANQAPALFSPVGGSSLVASLMLVLLLSGVLLLERINALLMFGMGITFFTFLILGASEVDVTSLSTKDWSKLPRAFPISFTAFAFQGTMPTVVRSLHRDRRSIVGAVAIGVALPLLCYTIWHIFVAGIVPCERLLTARALGENSVIPLGEALHSPVVRQLGNYFGFFALMTSLLGVSVGMRDFLADGLHIEKKGRGRWISSLLTLLPPLAISYLFPGLFLKALEYAGGIGTALILGLIPILMAWQVRKNPEAARLLFPKKKGTFILSALTLLIFLELACQFRLI